MLDNGVSSIQIDWHEITDINAISLELEREFVHLFFNIEGEIQFEFGPVYSRFLKSGNAYLIYNPDRNLSTVLRSSCAKLVIMTLELSSLHELFAPGTQQAPVFNPENSNRKFYEEKEISTSLMIVLNQLFTMQLAQNSERLYRKAKSYEILSLFFSESEINKPNCPFLNDENVILKIKNAKEILLKNYQDPPKIQDLSTMCGLNEYQLKTAFKEIYGNSPYQYLLDYKLELSRNMLQSGKLQVNEVAYQLGYSNPSHFIEAFRKKYGTTPKKLINH